MNPSKVLLKPLQKRALYLATGLLWLTGALWLYYKYYGQVQGAYGVQANPAEPIILEIHGAAAMAFLIIFGTLLLQHVPVGWKQKRQRPSGLSLMVLSGVLILTGWGLYYAVGETLRRWIYQSHAILGLAFPILIAAHVWWGANKKLLPPSGNGPVATKSGRTGNKR